MPYEDTPNKQCIRREWDLPILRRWAAEFDRSLTYFGLSGPNLYDLLDWREVLARERTSVEEMGTNDDDRQRANEAASRAVLVSELNHIQGGFQLLRGDIGEIIVDGVDTQGLPPQVNDNGTPEGEKRRKKAARKAKKQKRGFDPSREMRFRYDLVNLDFDGGLGNTTARVEAIRRLFHRQAEHPFVLFLTLNVRSKLRDAIDYDLSGLRTLEKGAEWERAVAYYTKRNTPVPAKLKAVVPPLIRQSASEAGLSAVAYPAIVYQGHETAVLVHFCFEIRRAAGRRVFRGISPQNEKVLVSLPLLRADEGRLDAAPAQHPGCSGAELTECLPLYPEPLRDMLTTIVGSLAQP
jgi:hypothetical protein